MCQVIAFVFHNVRCTVSCTRLRRLFEDTKLAGIQLIKEFEWEKKYHTVGIVPKVNSKICEKAKSMTTDCPGFVQKLQFID